MNDHRTPLEELDIAGQAVRAFLHKTDRKFHPKLADWAYPSDAYRALGELGYLVGLLSQAFDHITGSLRGHLEAGALGIDCGTTYAGRPEAAVEAVAAELGVAQALARSLETAVSNAQHAINAAHHLDAR